MNEQARAELLAQAQVADWRLIRTMRDYLRHPTERNACYVVGWLAGAATGGLLTAHAATYWRSAVAVAEGNDIQARAMRLALEEVAHV